MAKHEEARISLMNRIRVGRYYIINYDEHLINRMKSLARHVYAIRVIDGKKYVCDFDHSPRTEKVMITDKFIALTSSHDMMSWDIVMNDLLFMKDKSIVF